MRLVASDNGLVNGTMRKSEFTIGVEFKGFFRHSCPFCGLSFLSQEKKVTHQCSGNYFCIHRKAVATEIFPPPQGGGDLLSTGLKALGITTETYSDAKASMGLQPNCSCEGRQTWLNKFTEKLGLGEGQGAELQSVIATEKLTGVQVNECKIHGKCLPDLRVAENQLDIIRESGYWPCQGCEEREATLL